MGQASSGLTQPDVEEVILGCNHLFTQSEIEPLYWRFRSLDRGRKGFVTADELLSIPELSVNPLAQRVVRMLDNCNFKDYVRFLANFSDRASPEQKLKFIFDVYDVDGDGLITADDLTNMLRHLVGSQLSQLQVEAVLKQAFAELGVKDSFDFDTLARHLGPEAVVDLKVAIPLPF